MKASAPLSFLAGLVALSVASGAQAQNHFVPNGLEFQDLDSLRETVLRGAAHRGQPQRQSFTPDLLTLIGTPHHEIGSMDRVRIITESGQNIFRQSVSWSLLLDMADSNPLKTEKVEQLMNLSPECRLRLPLQAIQEILAQLPDPKDRLWALAVGLGGRAPQVSVLGSGLRSEDRHFSPSLWAQDNGAFRGFLIGTRSYERKLESPSMHATTIRHHLARAEEARRRGDLASARFYEDLAASYQPLLERDLEWRRSMYNEGTPRELTPALSRLANGVSDLWWADLNSALDIIHQAESCQMSPLVLTDLFQWQDIESLVEIVKLHGDQLQNPQNNVLFKRQLKNLILTASQRIFSSTEDYGTRGGLGTLPILGDFFERSSWPKRFIRTILELASESAFESGSTMTEKSCREADAIASYALQLGFKVPALAKDRSSAFIDFETYRNGARAILAAGAAMATSNRKNSKKDKTPTPLSVACSKAFVSLTYLWSGTFEFQEILMLGAKQGFGSWSGETVHLQDPQCSDWKFGLQIKDASRTEISRPKDRSYNPPKESHNPRLGPPPPFVFSKDPPVVENCGLAPL